MNQSNRTRKALILLTERIGSNFDFSLLHGNQHRQTRRVLYNALHGKTIGNVNANKLKHDFYYLLGVEHSYSITAMEAEFKEHVAAVMEL